LAINEITDFAVDAIAPGSVLYTDGAPHYSEITSNVDLVHEQINLVASGAAGHAVLPAVHRVSSLLKRWLAGTLHHGQSVVQPPHQQLTGPALLSVAPTSPEHDPHPYHHLTATPLEQQMLG
jgi:hypothetical protein